MTETMTEDQIIDLCSRVYDEQMQNPDGISGLLKNTAPSAVMVAMRRAAEAALSAAGTNSRDAEPVDWRTDATPKDGTPIYIRVIQPFRYLPYKPNSQQAKRGDAGRWQMMNEYGGWENCSHPLGNEWCLDPFRAALGQKGE